MATSDTEICNLALAALGEGESIANLDEATKQAAACKLHYPTIRDALLRQHKWNFATKRATLAASSTAPDWEYTYAYPLPNDCLRLIRTIEDDYTTADWRLESHSTDGPSILTNDTTCKIEYIFRNETVTQYDPLFVELLSNRLATKLAVQMTSNSALTERLYKIYEALLSETRTMDAQEGSSGRSWDTDTWTQSRL